MDEMRFLERPANSHTAWLDYYKRSAQAVASLIDKL